MKSQRLVFHVLLIVTSRQSLFIQQTKKKIDAAIQTERADAASLRTGWRTDRVVLGGG